VAKAQIAAKIVTRNVGFMNVSIRCMGRTPLLPG
jgi:hypothetical protein